MKRITRWTATSAVAATLLAGACKESTSPSSSDPSAMATAVSNLNAAFSQNAVFQSLAVLSSKAVLAAPAAVPLLVPGFRAAARSTPRDVMLQLARRAPAAALALFPANELGKTFQWDTAAGGRYRIVDSTKLGAPTNGVRFILYAVDTATLKPVLPLTTTGYVDLSDVSQPSYDGIHLVLHVGSLTAADYTVSEVRTTSSLSLTAVGYVQDVVTSGPQVSFDLSHLLSLPDSSLVSNYQASGNGATLTMQTSYSGAAAGNAETLDWLFQKNGSVEVIGGATTDSTNVEFKFNGATFATVRAATGGQPAFSGPNGRALTTGEMLALLTIVEQFAETYVNLTLVFLPALVFFA